MSGVTNPAVRNPFGWLLLRRASGQEVPLAALLCAGLNGIGCAGWLLFRSMAGEASVSAQLSDSDDTYARAGQIFAIASAAVFAGGLAGARIRLRRPAAPGAGGVREFWASVPVAPLVLAALIPMACTVLAYGPAGLVERARYSDTVGPPGLVRLAGLLAPIGIALTALVLVRAQRRFTDWAAVLPHLRLNAYTPTNGLGELANYGTLPLAGAMLLLGFVLMVLQRWNAALPATFAALAATVGMGMTGAILLNLLQYNLRPASRFLWYFVLLSLLLHFVLRRRRA
jgi:hypothetical protein